MTKKNEIITNERITTKKNFFFLNISYSVILFLFFIKNTSIFIENSYSSFFRFFFCCCKSDESVLFVLLFVDPICCFLDFFDDFPDEII